MILSDIQNEYGYIPLDSAERSSRSSPAISVAEIYGVVNTFYLVLFPAAEGQGLHHRLLPRHGVCYVKGARSR